MADGEQERAVIVGAESEEAAWVPGDAEAADVEPVEERGGLADLRHRLAVLERAAGMAEDREEPSSSRFEEWRNVAPEAYRQGRVEQRPETRAVTVDPPPEAVIPKRELGKYRLIHNLSFPEGGTVNDGIPRELCVVRYTSFDSAEVYYFDKCMPMGCSIACAYFEAFITFLHWVVERRSGSRDIVHYLDDFLFVGRAASGDCLHGLGWFQRVADEFGIPLSAEKTEGPSNKLVFLGIELDSEAMESRLPLDKVERLRGLAPVSTCSESCGPGFRKAILDGQPVCCFDCVPCSEDEFSNQTDATDCMKCPDDQWPTKRNDGCQEKSIEFLSYQEPLGVTLAVTSVLGALVPASILAVFIWKHHTPLVKANNRELSYLLLLALILCFGCSLVFIGHPTNPVCMVRQIAFGVVFAICISCLLAKTIIVTIAFKATKPNSNLRSWVGPQLPSTLVLACSLVQVLICVTWLIVAPPFSQMSMKSQMGKIIFECNEGSLLAFWCMLGYMGLLASISFIVAFLARKLPDSFNEAKFITFSMLIFIAVWLSFIPAYLSTRGKYTVAVEIFAILSSSAGLLGCIFFPKCYVILIRPEMNTKEFLMGKTTGNLKNAK
ncbi:vomeronasal type-2 receptor 26-like [Rhinatrema bivittatum]|uniref:vomeronasal type-2 receptor 26-like n=1 Tax=Rhinatrema bivittatum TaxID=194408 RepID=UPI00112B0AB4|nr:vomeronasal type-2 receptor 26-like [Rhinatrema bivittatum]